MEKVIFVLKDGAAKTRCRPLATKIEQAGIPVEICSIEEAQQSNEQAGEEGPEQERMPEELSQDVHTLYITDCNETVSFLRSRDLPVLGFLHEEGDYLAGIDYLMECPEEVNANYLDRVYRRYRGIPWKILETERCILRETIVEDVDSFLEIYQHPDIVKHMDDFYPVKGGEKSYIQEYIEKVYRYFEFGIWTVILKETGEIIGRAGFSVREGYEHPELGFVIGVPWQGKGIAYEICNAILEYGREEFGFECVQVLVMPENAASLALCHKLGFVQKEKVTESQKEYFLSTIEDLCNRGIR